MILGSIVVDQLRFRNIEVPDFPKKTGGYQ